MGIKGYKGFDAGMICRGMKFEVGKIYEEPKARLCECGFHFCTNPLDVLRFYKPTDGETIREYAEVEALGEVYADNEGIKYCTRKIKIVRSLSLADLAEESVKKTDQAYTSTNTGYCSAATNTGSYSVATNTGNYSVATNTGNCSVATNTGFFSAATNTGDYSVATNTGNYSVATNTGNCSVAKNTGFFSAATNIGDYSVATNTGYCSVATNTGNCSVATNTGDRSVATNMGDCSAATNSGKSSFAICTGFSGKAKGALGCYIALAEWEEQDGDRILKCFKSHKVDGKTIKPDVFYTLKNGKFVEE